MNEDFKKIFKEVPEFLSILGFKKAYYDEDKDSWNVEFLPTKSLTHSDGTILQGGFVTGMMDASMAQFIHEIFKFEKQISAWHIMLVIKHKTQDIVELI